MSNSKQKLLIYFEYLLKYANEITIIADSDFYITEANELTLKAYGFTRDELLKKSFYDLISRESKVEIDTRFRNINPKDSLSIVTKTRKKNGPDFIAEINIKLIRNEEEVYYIITLLSR